MKRIPMAALLLLLPGCAWLGGRVDDLGDIVRVEGSIGVGLQANMNAGELLHLGLGSSRRWSAGWAYGLATEERRVEDHFPLSFVSSLIHPDAPGLHTLQMGPPDAPFHRCPMVAPVTFERGTIRKPPMQFWSLEAGVMALVIGAEVGFNPAELADFLLGIFGIDIGSDDDPDGRARRKLWIPTSPILHSER